MLQKTDEQDDETAVAGESPISERGAHVPIEEAVIGPGLKIVGMLESEGDIVIAGAVKGDITSHGLTAIQDAGRDGASGWKRCRPDFLWMRATPSAIKPVACGWVTTPDVVSAPSGRMKWTVEIFLPAP